MLTLQKQSKFFFVSMICLLLAGCVFSPKNRIILWCTKNDMPKEHCTCAVNRLENRYRSVMKEVYDDMNFQFYQMGNIEYVPHFIRHDMSEEVLLCMQGNSK